VILCPGGASSTIRRALVISYPCPWHIKEIIRLKGGDGYPERRRAFKRDHKGTRLKGTVSKHEYLTPRELSTDEDSENSSPAPPPFLSLNVSSCPSFLLKMRMHQSEGVGSWTTTTTTTKGKGGVCRTTANSQGESEPCMRLCARRKEENFLGYWCCLSRLC
jgi:hypothetical protein